jgi:hypothetical protein
LRPDCGVLVGQFDASQAKLFERDSRATHSLQQQ